MKWIHTAMIAAVLAAAISIAIMNVARPGDAVVDPAEEEPASAVHLPSLNVMELAQILGVRVWEYVVPEDMEGHLEMTWEETGHAPERLTATLKRSWERGRRLVVGVRETDEGFLEITLFDKGNTSNLRIRSEKTMGSSVHVSNVVRGIGVIGDDGVLFLTHEYDPLEAGQPEVSSVLRLRIVP